MCCKTFCIDFTHYEPTSMPLVCHCPILNCINKKWFWHQNHGCIFVMQTLNFSKSIKVLWKCPLFLKLWTSTQFIFLKCCHPEKYLTYIAYIFWLGNNIECIEIMNKKNAGITVILHFSSDDNPIDFLLFHKTVYYCKN